MSATIGGNLVDGSGAIATGGTSQQVFARNVGRQYLLIQNISDETMWVNFGIAAVQDQPSIRIVSGAALEFSSAGTGVVPTATVNIISATTGKKYVAKEA